ncbi:MAG TPA: hypothetical protein VHV78_00285, partial [Gemmatimonadaceae bacterium]|nr:hypothetical protein [Gemmatimonadaceae bacterium]
MKPLLIAASGRAIATSPLGRREDDVELRRVLALPTAVSLDLKRPTVIVLDRALITSAGDDVERLRDLARCAALVALGDAGEDEPPSDYPIDVLTGYLPADAAPGT